MKNLIKSTRASAYLAADKSGYVVVAAWDVTQEEIEAAIDAEEELEKFRRCASWN